MKIMSTEDLSGHLNAGPVALFDVRGDVDFEILHIPGAKTAPLGSLTFRVASVMNNDSMVVVYGSGDDGLAQEAAERLEGLGQTNVFVYADGLSGWQTAGHEATPSKNPKLHTQGEFLEVRGIVVDTETAYSGAFKHTGKSVESAGG